MSIRTLSVAQWAGVLAAPLVWTAQHVVGFGVGVASCSAGGQGWHLDYDVWQYVLLSLACVTFLVAETSAAAVFLQTREEDYGDGPPENGRPWETIARRNRLHFFATAALVANVLFLAIPLLDGIASVASALCRQS